MIIKPPPPPSSTLQPALSFFAQITAFLIYQVAQHTQMAEEADQIRIQIERFHRRNNHLPQMMEDVTKMFKKRKRK